MAKKIAGYIKLTVPAGTANPSPPIGPALGQRGLNIMEFCKAFNAATQNFDQGTPIPTIITAYVDRSFAFKTKTPPAAWLILKAVQIDKGCPTPGRETKGTINVNQLREIARAKMPDLNANDIDAAIRIVAGTARSMGVELVE